MSSSTSPIGQVSLLLSEDKRRLIRGKMRIHLRQDHKLLREGKIPGEKIYEVFRLPLVEIVLVKDESGCWLSSLAPVKYSQLSKDETEMFAGPSR